MLLVSALKLVLPELGEPSFSQCSVARGRLQVAMSEIVRQRSGIMPVISKLVASAAACADAPGTVASLLGQFVAPFARTKPLSLACPLRSRTHKVLRLVVAAAREAQGRVGDGRFQCRL